MFLNALPIARDIAVVFLVLQWLVIAALPLFILIKITGGMRRFLPKVRPALRQVHEYECRVLAGVERWLGHIRAPFVWARNARLAVQARLERLGLAGRS